MLSNRHILAIGAIATLFSASAFSQNAVIVNGKSIPKAQLDKLVQKSGQPDNPQVRDQAREMLVTKELILQEADRAWHISKRICTRTARAISSWHISCRCI
jgi:peptidyl-prolyl cis-trans isomerase C